MKTKTVVVNLWGGPGTGKSTTAALLFALLKQDGVNTELVREYVKEWAWEGRKPGVFDQFYFFGKQSRKESLLYGKVDVIVTDSPVMLASFYADKYAPKAAAKGLKEVVKAYYETSEAEGYSHMHIFLQRTKAYNAAGRYQTKEEATALDHDMRVFLRDMKVSWGEYGTSNEEVGRLAGIINGMRKVICETSERFC